MVADYRRGVTVQIPWLLVLLTKQTAAADYRQSTTVKITRILNIVPGEP